jgi:urease accessory protein
MAAALGVIAAGVLAAAPAGAHTGVPAGGMLDGAVHPVLGLDHLLAIMAVGVLAVLLRGRLAVATLPLAFVGGMVAGGVVGLAGAGLPGVEVIIAASVVGVGVLVASGRSAAAIPAGWLVGMTALAGTAHGHAHGAEAPAAASPVPYVAGFLVVTLALHGAGTALGLVARRSAAVRCLAGGAVAGTGVALIAG